MLKLSSIKKSSSTVIALLIAASFLLAGCASPTLPPRDCPPIVVPSKYKAAIPPLETMPEGSADDADALDVITGNYAKYHLLDVRYRSLIDWADGLNEQNKTSSESEKK